MTSCCIFTRCYLPTGKVCWLCEEHQKGPHMRVLNDDVTASVSNKPLTTEHDVILKEYVEKYSHLREPYRTKKNQRPPAPTRKASQLAADGMNEVNFYCSRMALITSGEYCRRPRGIIYNHESVAIRAWIRNYVLQFSVDVITYYGLFTHWIPKIQRWFSDTTIEVFSP